MRRSANLRWPLLNDEASALQVHRDDLGPNLVGVADALAALEPTANARASARSEGRREAQRRPMQGYHRVEANAYADGSSGSLLSGGRPSFARAAFRVFDVYARRWGTAA